MTSTSTDTPQAPDYVSHDDALAETKNLLSLIFIKTFKITFYSAKQNLYHTKL